MGQKKYLKSGWYTNAQGNQQYGINPADVEAYGNETPTPAPVARTPRFSDFKTDTTLEDFYKNLSEQSKTPVDEAGIRQKYLAGVQSELDALNSVYDNILANVKIQGASRSGQTRAIVSKKGNVGSEIGTGQMNETTAYNAQQEQAVQAERASRLSAVLDKATSRADAKIESQITEKGKQADEYIQYLKDQNTAAREDLKTLANSGLKLEDVADQDYLKLLKDSGFDSETEFEAYWNANSPKDKQVKYDYKELKDGTLLRYGDDGSYKVLSDISLPKDGNWTITQLDDGSLVAYDKNQSADGTFKMEKLGKYAKAPSGNNTNNNVVKLTATQKSKLAKLFNGQEITDLESAINTIGINGVLENVTDEGEKSLINEVFGTGPEDTSNKEDQQLQDLGYSAADIREYKKAKSARPGMSIEPVKFLQDLQAAKDAGDSSKFVEQWLNG